MIWLRLPDSWPQPVTAAVTLLLLTALDLAGTVAAKEAVERRSVWAAAVGACLFALMWWVFASCLGMTGLVVVTVGWCVLVQVGVLLMARLRYGEQLPQGKLIAVVLAIGASVYLVAAPTPIASDSAELVPVRPPTLPVPATILPPAVLLSPAVVWQHSDEDVVRTGRHAAPSTGQPRPAAGRRIGSGAAPRPGRHAASAADQAHLVTAGRRIGSGAAPRPGRHAASAADQPRSVPVRNRSHPVPAAPVPAAPVPAAPVPAAPVPAAPVPVAPVPVVAPAASEVGYQ